jgi:uncharacterized membrane protein YGL010W
MGWTVLGVPEPSTYLMIGCVLAFVGYGYARRQKPAKADEPSATTEPLPASPA